MVLLRHSSVAAVDLAMLWDSTLTVTELLGLATRAPSPSRSG